MPAIPARISLVSLGVADVARSTAFYQALGWRRSSSSADGVISFFHTCGAVLDLFEAGNLAEDADLARSAAESVPSGFRGFTLAVNVGSREEVDEAFAAVSGAGGADRQVAQGGRLGWLFRLLRRSRRLSLGDRPQPGLAVGRAGPAGPAMTRRASTSGAGRSRPRPGSRTGETGQRTRSAARAASNNVSTRTISSACPADSASAVATSSAAHCTW